MKPFRSYDALRLFVTVAQHLSFTAAGQALNLTKGAVSYQIKQLEQELGFALFLRVPSGIVLTEKGRQLHTIARNSFTSLETAVAVLKEEGTSITIGTSTYFASRWLAPRLMRFITQHPHIRLRLQPVIGAGDLPREQLDLMIRWGKGEWSDVLIEPLFLCPAIATAGQTVARQIQADTLESVLPQLTLLHDCEDSVAWRDWFVAAGLPYRPRHNPLVIPDPNVRVQAVISGQGVALNDALVSNELASKQLVQISSIQLDNYGYFLAYTSDSLNNPALRAFYNWLLSEAG